MFTAFGQFFRAICMFFVALENIGKATVVLTEVAVETSNSFADEAKINRAKAQVKMNAELAIIKANASKEAKVALAAEAKAA